MQATQAEQANATGLVRISLQTRRVLKVESAARGISMLAAIEEAVSAWLGKPKGVLDKRATDGPARPSRRSRKSA